VVQQQQQPTHQQQSQQQQQPSIIQYQYKQQPSVQQQQQQQQSTTSSSSSNQLQQSQQILQKLQTAPSPSSASTTLFATPTQVKLEVPPPTNSTSSPSPVSISGAGSASATETTTAVQSDSSQVLTKQRLDDLVREVDPNEQLDDDVKETLLQIADEFIESVVSSACQIAKHRKSNAVDVKDVQLCLERNWNMWIPGFGTDDIRPYKKACVTDAHKQRTALIKKTLKKI